MRREKGDTNGKAEERAVACAYLVDATRTTAKVPGVAKGALPFRDLRAFCRLAS
jgi:hypothetical protein